MLTLCFLVLVWPAQALRLNDVKQHLWIDSSYSRICKAMQKIYLHVYIAFWLALASFPGLPRFLFFGLRSV